eukprot:3252307-Amphidinium_carterae.1
MHCDQAVRTHKLDDEDPLSGLDAFGEQQVQRMIADLDLDVTGPSMIPVGLWTDATPYSFDRKQSLEVLSLSFPGALKRGMRSWPHSSWMLDPGQLFQSMSWAMEKGPDSSWTLWSPQVKWNKSKGHHRSEEAERAGVLAA